MIKFSDPYMLFGLWAVILLAGVLIYGHKKRKKIIHSYAGAPMRSSLIPGFNIRKRWIKGSLHLSAVIFCIFALAGPMAGYKWVKIQQKGVDIMIALDCSRSMLAEDIKPNRLERAKREIIDLLNKLESDRAGLVAFSGQAILQCPLTLDHEAFHLFLKVLSPDYLPVGGTHLTAAIAACLDAFEPDSVSDKAIILITDGEDTVSDPEQAARRAAEMGVKIFTIGVGNSEGAPIPAQGGGFKKDDDGNIVLSKVDTKTLETLSQLTKGKYVRSVAGDMDLDTIYYAHVKKDMDQKAITDSKKKVWENRFQWMLLPAVLCLLIELIVSVGVKPKTLLPALMMVFLMAGWHSESEAFTFNSVKKGIEAYEGQQYDQAKNQFIKAQLNDPENPKLYYDIGTAAYKNQEYALALKNFKTVLDILGNDSHEDFNDHTLRHKSLYNLANTKYRLGNYDDAIHDYESIIEEFPEDQLSKENLEFVKKKKQEQEQQEKQQDQNKGQNKENDQNKQNQDKKDQKDKPGDQKNQENKDKPDQNRKDDSKKQNEQNQPDQKQSDQDKSNPEKSGQATSGQEKETQPEPGQPPEPKPEPENPDQKNEGQAHQAQQAGDPGKPDPSKNAQINDNMLNRLQDKPGQALMPLTRPRKIKNDW